MRRFAWALAAALAASPGLVAPAAAQRALYIVNYSYATLPDLRRMRAVGRTAPDWEDALSFAVTDGRDLSLPDMVSALEAGLADTDPDAPLVIVLGGHFVHGAGGAWLLGTEARAATPARLPRMALPVSLVLDIAAQAPGRALVVLAVADAERDVVQAGSGLAPGLGALSVPQGVRLVSGPARAVAAALSGPLLAPGTQIAQLPGIDDRLAVSGFLPLGQPFLSRAALPAQGSGDAPPPLFTAEDPSEAERDFWVAVRELDSEAAYGTYLDRYPPTAASPKPPATVWPPCARRPRIAPAGPRRRLA